MQHMVNTCIATAPFHSHGVLGLFYHADHTMITLLIPANFAFVTIRQVKTLPAETDVPFRLQQRFRQTAHILFRHIDDVVRQTESRFIAKPGKTPELIIHTVQGFYQASHITFPES